MNESHKRKNFYEALRYVSEDYEGKIFFKLVFISERFFFYPQLFVFFKYEVTLGYFSP